MVDYIAGPMWPQNDGRVPGDPVPEAPEWGQQKIDSLIRWRQLDIKPRGHWVYRPTGRYHGALNEQGLVDIDGLAGYVVSAMLNQHLIERVDSADLECAGEGTNRPEPAASKAPETAPDVEEPITSGHSAPKLSRAKKLLLGIKD